MTEKDLIVGLTDHAAGLGQGLAVDTSTRGEAELLQPLLESVDTWARRRVDDARIDAEAKIPGALYKEAAELGLFGLALPERYGGAGLSLGAAGPVVARLSEHDRSVATAIGLHNGLGSRGLVAHGRPELKAELLPRMARGERIAAFAATEAGAGSHIAGVKTRALPGERGRVRVNGEKVFVTNGGIAHIFTVLASSPGLGGARRGHSLLVLDREDGGVSTGPEEHKLGLKGSSTTSLFLDDVSIPDSRILGTPGKGLDLIADVLAFGRTFMSWGCLGTTRRALALAADQVTRRVQFGQPLVAFGQVRTRLAEVAAEEWATESLLRLTSRLADAEDPRMGWVSTLLKIQASEAAGVATDVALQLHGGSGFIEEVGVARLARDARITRIFEGANEVLRLHAAAPLLTGLHGGGHLADHTLGTLSDEAHAFDALHLALFEAVHAARDRRGFRVAADQGVLASVADAGLSVLVGLAGILRFQAEAAAGLAGDTDLALARHALALYLDRGHRALGNLAEAESRDLRVEPVVRGVLSRHGLV